jgi:hypothetical protein
MNNPTQYLFFNDKKFHNIIIIKRIESKFSEFHLDVENDKQISIIILRKHFFQLTADQIENILLWNSR